MQRLRPCGAVQKQSITSTRFVNHKRQNPFHLQAAMHIQSMSKEEHLWKRSDQSTKAARLLEASA